MRGQLLAPLFSTWPDRYPIGVRVGTALSAWKSAYSILRPAVSSNFASPR